MSHMEIIHLDGNDACKTGVTGFGNTPAENSLRNAYEQARGVLRYDGIYQQRDGLLEAIETLRVVDGNLWGPSAAAQGQTVLIEGPK